MRKITENPPGWGTQEWRRAGNCECEICGKEFIDHPIEQGPGYGRCGDEILTLWRLCDGSLVHL